MGKKPLGANLKTENDSIKHSKIYSSSHPNQDKEYISTLTISL